jgi:hypothetical protein
MKSHALLRGSSAGLAAVIQVDTTVGFLLDRQQTVGLSPLGSSPSAYVWRRVFIPGRGARA